MSPAAFDLLCAANVGILVIAASVPTGDFGLIGWASAWLHTPAANGFHCSIGAIAAVPWRGTGSLESLLLARSAGSLVPLLLYGPQAESPCSSCQS